MSVAVASLSARDLALIGAGRWGVNLARNFDALGALRVVCDVSTQVTGSVQQTYPHVTVTASYADVLADSAVHKVAIAAPAAQHFELARAALRANKDVFVEKPLCLSLRDAETLVELAESRNKTLMVGHLLRYHPCVVGLIELVSKGELGRILTITSTRLNLGRFRTEEDALWSFAPHDISAILALLGDELPENVRCWGRAHLSRSVADSTLTMMRFASGATAQIHVSWLNPFKEQKLTIVGTAGMAVFDDTQSWSHKLRLYRDYMSWPEGAPPAPLNVAGEALTVPEQEPLAAECAHFLDACRERRRPRTDGHEGLRVLAVLDAARQSLSRDGDAVSAVTAARSDFFAHPTALIAPSAKIGAGTKIWQFSSVQAGASIGERCNLGQNVHVAERVVLGSGVKVQNNVSIYEGVVVEDNVFLGPACVFTNVKNPRAEISRRHQYQRTTLRRGASVGANATLVCGITLGRYSFIGAGAVVTRDVPDYALMLGNPARQNGWMSRHGQRLTADADGLLVCSESGLRYREESPGVLRCLDLDEDAPLPEPAH